MKLKFLGTSSVLGSPVWNCSCPTCTSSNPKNTRKRSSLLVQIGDKNVIVDCGPDFSSQLRENGIRKIHCVVVTHAHGDHTNGMEQLSAAEDCLLLAPSDVWNEFFYSKTVSRAWFEKRNSSGLVLKDFTPFKINNISIDSIKLEHQKDALPEITPCYGYLFKSDKSSFAYCSDYNKILEPQKVQNLDLLISDASGWENDGRGHVGVKGAIEVFEQFQPKKMLLTHIPHRVEHEKLVKFLKDNEYKNIQPAFDGMEVELK